MRSIYTHAQHVVIWIGLEDESTKLALGLIRTAAACARKEIATPHRYRLAHGEAKPVNSGLRRIDREPWTEEKLKQWGLPSAGGTDYKAFRHFCDREWFSRVWTKQEAIFAISATMFIGEERLDWLHFILAIEFFIFKRLPTSNLTNELNLTCMASRAWSASSTPRFYNLETLLSSTRNLKASELRDKIHGVLGLAKKDKYGRGILIDYEKPVKELFTQTTRYLISRSYDVGFSLKVLSFVGHPWPQFDDFPFWVPQLHKPLPTERSITHDEEKFMAGGKFSYFNYLDVEAITPSEVDSLRLQGFVACTIEYGKTFTIDIEADDVAEVNFKKFWAILIALFSFVDSSGAVCITGESMHAVFAQVLSFGMFR
jgi:hypothetical protein